MNKYTLITIIGIFATILSQFYWLYGSYQSYFDKYQSTYNEIFAVAIDLEVNYRWTQSPINLNNPKLIIRSSKDMTPEERASLKGDTIELDRAQEENLGKNFTELLQQKIQDDSMTKCPLNINILDSLFASHLAKSDLLVHYQIYQYDKDQEIIAKTNHKQPKHIHYIYTDLKPIGTKGLMFVQAKVEVPTTLLLKNMLFSLCVSTLMAILLICCLYRQLRVINRTRKQLKERENSVYHAIHDLKSPLNITYAMIDFMLIKEMDDKWVRILTNNKKQIRKLSEIIETMLALTRDGDKPQPLNLQDINLQELGNSCYNMVTQLYPDKPHIFNIDIAGQQTPIIQTDSNRLERCLQNLIENAFKYSDAGVTITLQIMINKDNCIISVQDTGWGISLKDQKKLGKQFYRIQHPGKPLLPGYGIGLSCVRQLSKELGGTFTFSSKEHEGSIFIITLPLNKTKA